MAEDAESNIAIRFVEKRISLPLLYRANSTAGKSLTQ